MGPNLPGGGDSGPWELCEALRCDIRGDFVGFLINWKGGTEEQGVLLFLGLEMLCCLPEVVVYVSWLESCELERMNSCIGFEGPW